MWRCDKCGFENYSNNDDVCVNCHAPRYGKEKKQWPLLVAICASVLVIAVVAIIALKPSPTSSTVVTQAPAIPAQSYKWSEWSDWSTNAVSESSTREVETRQSRTLIGYNMVHYGTQQEKEPHYRMFRDYSIEGNYEKYGARSSYPEKHLTKTVTVSQMNKASSYPANGAIVNLTYNGKSYGGYQMGTTTAYNFGDDYYIWFIESEEYSVVTEYRHRDLVQVP